MADLGEIALVLLYTFGAISLVIMISRLVLRYFRGHRLDAGDWVIIIAILCVIVRITLHSFIQRRGTCNVNSLPPKERAGLSPKQIYIRCTLGGRLLLTNRFLNNILYGLLFSFFPRSFRLPCLFVYKLATSFAHPLLPLLIPYLLKASGA
jgi:hypothetical protein